MKVRRKSEIAEAVQWDGTMEKWPLLTSPKECGAVKGTWLILHKDGHRKTWTLESPTDFHAHYEPVPEPPAAEENVCRSCRKEGWGPICPICYAARGSAAPSVSEEQPARSESILGRIELDKNMSPTEVKLRTSKQEVTIQNLAPHRATLAHSVFSYPFSTICKNCQRSYGEHLGNDCLISDTRF